MAVIFRKTLILENPLEQKLNKLQMNTLNIFHGIRMKTLGGDTIFTKNPHVTFELNELFKPNMLQNVHKAYLIIIQKRKLFMSKNNQKPAFPAPTTFLVQFFVFLQEESELSSRTFPSDCTTVQISNI
ncbi:hypothetical protein BpHYR1_029198 [Brachionus plicatilis]|uniref:Uncharacterized protein n=1 Tax=Brachionus plicatilis TaxID=10195 RepID=A0A3M7Q5H7_BRAPC|nr:hypothetical protein BpHYR1_029198 [Brachionus plicatilis]